MNVVGTLGISISSLFCLLLLSVLIKFFLKVWWTPIYTQFLMRAQGIKGPNYRFLHGNTKEILNMRNGRLSRPMELSHDLVPRILPHIHQWSSTYGKDFLFWFGPKAHLVVTEPEFIKEILNNKDQAYTKLENSEYVRKLLGDGLVTTNGEKWAKQRKLANHAFRAESLKSMTPSMIASVEDMLERWKQHERGEIDAFKEFRILTSEVISRTAFGSSYLEGRDIFEMMSKLSIIISRNSFKIRLPGLSRFLKNKDDLESEKLEKRIRDSILAIMQKREKAANEENKFGNDFLGLLVSAYHDSDADRRVGLEDVVDECKTFYVAGHETSASLLAWVVLLLAIHSDWQEKAREEVLAVIGQQHPTLDGITRLKTLNMIVHECLRLYPPVPSISRRVKQDVRLGKFFLLSNMQVSVPTLAIHHNPQIWGDDAQLFKPERFSQGAAKATNNHPSAFLPFGLGPRICVGLNFATNEVKIALSMILQRYSFTLSPTYIHSPVPILVVQPQHGVQIMLHPL